MRYPLPVTGATLCVLALSLALGLVLRESGDATAGIAAGPPSPEASPAEPTPAEPSPSPTGGFQLTRISTGFNNPVGIDHHEPTNQVVISVNHDTGTPHNFELVAEDGARTQFSSISGLSDEVKIATARDRRGGFTPGELFVGTGTPGVVARVSPDGSQIDDPWVTLPDEQGLLRGSLHVDRTDVFRGDLIVVTTAGGVWRITSTGSPSLLTNVGTHLEGVTTVPNEERYGPWAGKILAGAEHEERIYAIDAEGKFEPHDLGIIPEDIDIIAASENFFGVDFGGKILWGATPAQFAGMAGDVLIAQEHPGILWHVRWNGTEFEKTELTRVEQWEHVTFSSAGIAEVGGLLPVASEDGGPSPALIAAAGVLAVLLAGGGGVLWAQRRRAAAGARVQLRRAVGREPTTPVFAGTGPLGVPSRTEAWLEVVKPGDLGSFPLGEDPVTVGFTGDCTVQLPPAAGQAGARLRVWKREGRYMLHNLSRVGNIKVAGKPATWAILEDGDLIELGPSRLVFRTTNPDDNQAPTLT